MNTPSDPNRSIAAWLEEEAQGRAPDRLLAATRQRIEATRQRRTWWPALRLDLANALRIGVATLALLVAAVVGANLVSGPNVGTEATPAPSQTTQPSAPPSPLSITRAGVGSLVPGRYVLKDVFPFTISFTFTTEWQIYEQTSRNFIAIYKDSPEPPNGKGVIVGIIDNVKADACDESAGLLDPPIGPTPQDFATAVANQPRTDVSAIAEVSLAGFSGSYLEFTTTGPQAECSNRLSRWPTPAGDRWGLPNLHDRLWILDVDGVRLVIDAWDFPEASDEDLAEVQSVVESIQIETLAASLSPSP